MNTIQHGADALILCGTTGEAPSLTIKSTFWCLLLRARQLQGVCHSLPAPASNDTRHAVAMSLEAKQCGADALLLVTPYYNKTNQAGLVRHYTAIADAAGCR